ncbi:Mitochondrial substrate carrier family protein L [Tolypocladium paradoxum]|uniref:Mitochondrial substrate carrier family protein L n=1 Tax=Tolypocladium paradoxum TaxID=94208 RepID=A0A2S4L2Z3_9HYPO|nr:Mitochondrial substrate carrier family protein L [Tolypocladium paradoxum]
MAELPIILRNKAAKKRRKEGIHCCKGIGAQERPWYTIRYLLVASNLTCARQHLRFLGNSSAQYRPSAYVRLQVRSTPFHSPFDRPSRRYTRRHRRLREALARCLRQTKQRKRLHRPWAIASSPVKPDSLSQPPRLSPLPLGQPVRNANSSIIRPPPASRQEAGGQQHSLTHAPHPSFQRPGPATHPLPLVLLPVRCVHRPSSAAVGIRPPIFTSSPSPLARRRSTSDVRTYDCTYSAHTPYSQRRSRLRTSCGRPSSPLQSHPGRAATTDLPGLACVAIHRCSVAATALHLSCTARPSASNQPSAKTLGPTSPACCPSVAARLPCHLTRRPAPWDIGTVAIVDPLRRITMGAESKKAPPLPAPTETETATPTELTTDVSKPGDEKSSYSLPEDGTPVTIRTRGHKANRSQTSLLIEYFEGGKGASGSTDRKPSVRVRLTPSKKSKGDHIQVTETKGSRKVSLTRRIPLDEAIAAREIDLAEGDDSQSMTSYASATEESNVSRNPIDIEIDRNRRRRRPASPLIPTGEPYQPGNPSEISAIPTDSFLDGSGPAGELKRSASTSRAGGEGLTAAAVTGALAGAAMGEISSNKTRGKERVKISDKSKDKSDRKRRSKSRTGSVSEHTAEEIRSSRHRSSRGHQESTVSAADSSVLSSNLSPSHRSLDARSMRSGASRSSINNPKLLETVEDAIRRLILPELSALKREQSKREARRGSLTSTATSASRDDVSTDHRRSSGQRGEHSRDGSRQKERRNREARHEYDDSSLHSASRESIDAEYHADDGDVTTPKRSNNLLKVAAAGAAGAALAKGISAAMDDKPESPERTQRDRRRRRTDSARSRSLGAEHYSEEYDEDDHHLAPAPPMPLMSDINPSEMTRTSILSADTDRPHSATEELVSGHDASRGMDFPSSTPTRARTPANLQQTLGTKHANVSHGDLTALPRGKKEYAEEYETDEFGRKVPMTNYDDYEGSREVPDAPDYPPEDDFEDRYFSHQDVPPPLKYVPYQAGARGLSPIPSVSGYTEGGSEAPLPQNPRDAHSPNAFSSPGKSPEHGRHVRSVRSQDSTPSNMRSRDFDQVSVDGDDADDQFEHTVAGQAVRGLGANPDFVHPPTAVESAVASLVDGSMLDQSVLTAASGCDYVGARDSTVSYDDQSKGHSSRGVSPEKMSIDSRRELEEERHATPGSRSQAQSQDFSEYDIDEYGRKVPRSKYRHSPTASEAAITAGAVGAAAAALKAAQERKQATVEEGGDEASQPAGVFRNKSFKERTMQGWEPRNTPAHSVDRLDFEESPKMGASGLPDLSNPMPEIGYVDDDLQTNPSVVEERLDGHRDDDAQWSGRATPTQRDISGYGHEIRDKDGGLGIAEVIGAAALGAAAGMAPTHSREPSQDQDEWHRTSDERKRDTLVTNPYEDASPIVNPALNENLLGTRGLDGPFHTGSPGFGQKYDEGYMSNGPNRTPDIDPKGKAVDFSGVALAGGDDPFYVSQSHGRHLSGMSQGMTSPFYDASTGAGIERIENKDIVALMQHLMVRDAQRSARDTEIVALLMNAALEMRNSFREMKELVQDTGDDVIFASVENTEKLQKAINGPRPYPGTASRSLQSGSQAGTIDDNAAKKKNLWKRALQGLSAKGTNDLSRIEDMLMQLLGEVDVLKTQTAAPPVSTGGPGQSYDNLQPEDQYEQDKGYEPEGNSTASHASQSGHLSTTQARGLGPAFTSERRFSDHRISTVEENDEEYEYDHASPSADRAKTNLLSPGQADDIQRGGSVPLETPPQLADPAEPQPLSAENTPRTERGKKHKSSSSSGWLPKISRWSETTASSVGRVLRGSATSKKGGPKYDDFQPPSRSGSSLASYEDNYRHDPYGEDKLHTGFSDQNLAPQTQTQARDQGPPPTAFMTPEDPKYKAHRNSLNLQHPQPRPGQTERFRTALETSAQEYNNPMTPRSTDWAGSATSLNRLPATTNRFSATSSAAAPEGDYWHSSPGPPRPPKEPIESPVAQTPPKSGRLSKVKETSSPPHQSSESGYGTLTGTHLSHYSGSSPKLENRNLSVALGVPTRRPTGPRAMTPKSPEEDAAREERRRKRDTFGTVASEDTDTF